VLTPSNPIGQYLNISTEFTDPGNLLTGSTRVGRMSFNNAFIFNLSFFIADLLFDSDLVKSLKGLFRHLSYSRENISLTIGKDIDAGLLLARIKQNLKKYSYLAWNDSQFSGVAHYYDYLLEFSQYTRGINSVSLFDYMKPLFTEARNRYPVNTAAEENTNALLALGMVAGDYNLRKFLSHVIGIELKPLPMRPKVLLAERGDLTLHFLYSTTIQILSSKGLSLSIGKLKEISDMGKGGSGFSFADLAADRTGIHFTTMAMDASGGATHLQSFLAKADSEKGFFPDIIGLQEQLSLLKFESEYRDTDSTQYKAVVNEIDRRIRLLPLFGYYR